MTKSEINFKYPFQNYNLTLYERVENLISLLTLKEKINFLVDLSKEIPRLGIKKYYHGNECLHGVVRPGRATVFPQAIAFGATWDPSLIFDVATAISDEARAKHHSIDEYPGTYNGLLTFWSPNVNMARDPRWGRTPETYGEDPYLTGQIGIEFVKGIQGNDPKYLKAVSTPKHYVGNNQEHNRFKLKPKISEKWLRDYFLLGFKALITKGKAQSIMGAYNAVFDIPCCHSKFLLTDILRNEWGFEGYAVTDCGGVAHALPYAHKYVLTPTKAAATSINAGIDLECGFIFRKGFLHKAVKKGLVTEERINFAARNVIRTRMKLGMFDPDEINPFAKIPFDVVGSKKHSDLALKTAEESIVLLKNSEINGKKLLPINIKELKSIAVIGPNTDVAQFGDYSGVPVNTPITPLMGLQSILEGTDIKINHVAWIPFNSSKKFSTIPSRNLKPKDDCVKNHGLVREYFPKQNFGGKSSKYLDEIIDMNYRSETADPTISNAQTDGNQDIELKNKFSVKWQGYICPDISGVYEIRLNSKGSSKFKNAKFKIADNKLTSKISIEMEANNKYPIEIQFPYAGLGSKINLQWKTPDFHESKTDFNFEREIEASKNSDLVICYSGLAWGDEHEGVDRKDFQLSQQQSKLIRKIYEVNQNFILILIAGSNLAINWENDNIPSILHAWYPGERGGDAIANVIFGDYNPAGRLPLTFYKNIDQIPPFDDYDLDKGRTYWFLKDKPLYPFGYGLSYSKFEYISMEIDKKEVSINDKIKIIVKVKNIGPLDGDEVIQLYVSFDNDSNILPMKQLKGFQRIKIKVGEIKEVEIPLDIEDISFWNLDNKKYEVYRGGLFVMIGASSQDIKFKEEIRIK